eukprot:TRINITY_DN12372_c0_g1_i2.p2 TRINITY_DN12372_c0_g1~~TRINITY_DN12372_c0_g1_i2.p2  ORF type:complete len:147 (+),score=13.62 TRINITY_DN12372_c0_g1_i2:65-505(+)
MCIRDRLYTGTGALKTDFTRTGKRTRKGALQDGRNSVMRYILNNFYDGYKQNCVDLCTGKLDPALIRYKRHTVNPCIGIAFMLVGIPLLLREVFGRLHVQIYGLNNESTWREYMLFGIMYLFSIAACLFFVKSRPHYFIERPILKQ